MKPSLESLKKLLLAATLLGSGLALATPVAATGLGLPPDASADGFRIDDLIHETLAFITVMFVIMVVWMVTAALRYGRKGTALYAHTTKRGQLVTWITIGVLGVADVSLYVRTMLDMGEVFWNYGSAEKDPRAVRIEVNAHQWAWQVRYAGADGKFNTPDDIVGLNDIRVPVGVPVIFELASTDVIHSLYLPNFRVKTDATPGMINKMWLRPSTTGEYEIGCAQHCGINHYKMKALFTVLPQADYDRWVREASANSERGYDAADTVSHWGWDWDHPQPPTGEATGEAIQAADATPPANAKPERSL